MLPEQSFRPSRAGAYIVKAAESPSTRVKAEHGPHESPSPTDADRRLARAVIGAKRRMTASDEL